MQWLNEKEKLKELISQGVSYDEIGKRYNVSGAAIRKAAPRIGIQLPRRRKVSPNETFNKGTAKTSICVHCGKTFINCPSSKNIYCSRKCAAAHKKQQYIKDWKIGKLSGTVNYTCSDAIRNYLLQKYNYKCEKCRWGELNQFTNKVPLQIHHIVSHQ